jgi:hypothetical protein
MDDRFVSTAAYCCYFFLFLVYDNKVRLMVNKESIEKEINLIFEVEERNIKNNKTFHYVQTSKEVEIPKTGVTALIRYSSGSPPLMDMELHPSDNLSLEWDTYTTLKKLYNNVELIQGCRNIFINHIEKKLSHMHSIYSSTQENLTIPTNSNLHSNASLAVTIQLGKNNIDSQPV